MEKYDDINPVNWNSAPVLDPVNIYNTTNAFDALNRPWKLTTADDSVQYHLFNESGHLEKVLLNHRGAINITAADETFDALTANTKNLNLFVLSIDYNEKGQRSQITYGNNTITSYAYDQKTFRLSELKTTSQDGKTFYQDVNYTYDPIGNITQIKDDAQQTIFFGNTVVEPVNDYTYDAVYQLTQATGREHMGQNVLQENNQNKNFRNFPFMPDNLPKPGDTVAMRTYTQQYIYDAVGNIKSFSHQGVNPDKTMGGFTRVYYYNNNDADRTECSVLPGTIKNNRLLRTQIKDDKIDYIHDVHGNMTSMPHLSRMAWNFKDELFATAETVMNDGTPATTFYVYDAGGIRVRKINNAQSTGTIAEERIYLGGYEIYRKYNGDVTKPTLERETLHVMDDKQRIAMVETKTIGGQTNDDNTIPDLAYLRYQYSNHLGSACLELDDKTNIISYEEYHPYGTTAYQAMNAEINPIAKRYRYTELERDEENGFGYHNARYYVSWLGRWTSCDSNGLGDGLNLYSYTRNNYIGVIDSTGKDSKPISYPYPAKQTANNFIKPPGSNPYQLGTDLPIDSSTLRGSPKKNPEVVSKLREYANELSKGGINPVTSIIDRAVFSYEDQLRSYDTTIESLLGKGPSIGRAVFDRQFGSWFGENDKTLRGYSKGQKLITEFRTNLQRAARLEGSDLGAQLYRVISKANQTIDPRGAWEASVAQALSIGVTVRLGLVANLAGQYVDRIPLTYAQGFDEGFNSPLGKPLILGNYSDAAFRKFIHDSQWGNDSYLVVDRGGWTPNFNAGFIRGAIEAGREAVYVTPFSPQSLGKTYGCGSITNIRNTDSINGN